MLGAEHAERKHPSLGSMEPAISHVELTGVILFLALLAAAVRQAKVMSM